MRVPENDTRTDEIDRAVDLALETANLLPKMLEQIFARHGVQLSTAKRKAQDSMGAFAAAGEYFSGLADLYDHSRELVSVVEETKKTKKSRRREQEDLTIDIVLGSCLSTSRRKSKHLGDLCQVVISASFLAQHIKSVDLLMPAWKRIVDAIGSLLPVETLATFFAAAAQAGDIASCEGAVERIRMFEPAHQYIRIWDRWKEQQEALRGIVAAGDANACGLHELSGLDFECLILAGLEKAGVQGRRTGGAGDFGADIILETKNNTRLVIQCKRYKERVNLRAVQEVVAAIRHYNADAGVVVAISGFFQSAIVLASSNGVELWGEDEIRQLLRGELDFSELCGGNRSSMERPRIAEPELDIEDEEDPE